MSLHKSDGLQDKVFILDYRESTTPLRVGPGRARLLRDSTPSRQGSTASLRVGRPRLGDSVNATPLALRVGRAQLPGPFPGRAAAASLVQWPSLTIQAPGHWHSESAGFEGPTPSRPGSTARQTEKRGRRPCRRPLLSHTDSARHAGLAAAGVGLRRTTPGPGPMGTWVAPARRTPAKPPCCSSGSFGFAKLFDEPH
jgi:hypothetical protein